MKKTNPFRLYKILLTALLSVAVLVGGVLFYLAQNSANKNAITADYVASAPLNAQEGEILYSSGGQTAIPANCLDRSVGACAWSDNVNTLTLARNDFSFDFVDVKNKVVKSIFNAGQVQGVKASLLRNNADGKLLMVATSLVSGQKSGTTSLGSASFVILDPLVAKPILRVKRLPLEEGVAASFSISPDLKKLFIAGGNRAKIWDIAGESTLLDEKCFGLTDIFTDWAPDCSGVAFVLNNEVFFKTDAPGGSHQTKLMDAQNCEWWHWVGPDKVAIATTFLRKMQVLHFTVSKSEVAMENRVSVKSAPKTFLTAASRADFGHVKMILRQNSKFFEAREADKCCEEFTCDVGKDIGPDGGPENCEVKYSPDGNYFAVASGRAVTVYSETKDIMTVLRADRFANAKNPPDRVSVEWSPDSSTLVVLGSGNSGTIEIVDVLNAETSSR